MLRKGGFNLRKWTANHPELLTHIPPEHKEIKEILELHENKTVKTLGIQWAPATDKFSFKITLPEIKQTYTKRSILSEIASLFDPFGWIAPVIIIAKIIMQKLWAAGCDCDDNIQSSLLEEWIRFRTELPYIQQIRIPRWMKFTLTAERIEIHGFCDASQQAYGAVDYIKITCDGNTTISLCAAKTKVAPIKTISLPKLKLNGAVLLAKLMKQIQQDLQLKVSYIHAWTDSTIALTWIKGLPSKWTFVANRVSEIQTNISPDSWHYVPTKDNPADAASRGIKPRELAALKLWWYGPEWLQHDKTRWPVQPATNDTELERRKIQNFFNIENNSILTRFSSYAKMIRVIAYWMRFRLKSHPIYLTEDEIHRAEIKVMTLLQKECFKDDIQHLKTKKMVTSKSRIINFNPFLDENGVIRVGGRLQQADLDYNQKHPMIIPNDHHVSKLLIRHIHLKTQLGGIQLVLNTLRQKFWLLNVRRTIRHQIRQCIRCFRTKPKNENQIMSNLPKPRVTISYPFQHVGVDYAGPISIKTSKILNAKFIKGYFCIFVCLATKAVHIEIVTELSTDGFIAAFKRFISRRGTCSDIYSDCGTNFVKANKLLNETKCAELIANERIKWHFNPPAAPHFGGLWEAAVKSIKTHLKRTLMEARLTYEELSTVCQIEACINSRPLVPLTSNPDDHNLLTPGHFLTGRNIITNISPQMPDNQTPLKRWQYQQLLTHQFWKKWSTEYLHTLQQREKWRTQQENLKINDIVIIKNEQTSPTRWPLGRVVEIFKSKDGNIRCAKVKTQSTEYIRPITKLCKLPFIQ